MGFIASYTDNPVAIAILRKRGYKEAYQEKDKWHIFYLNLGKTEKSPMIKDIKHKRQ
jgi:hypothetical protein